MKKNVEELEILAKQFEDEGDDNLSSLLIILASCRVTEEKSGTDLPEKSLLREASKIQDKIISAIMMATLLGASKSGDNSDYKDWLNNG